MDIPDTREVVFTIEEVAKMALALRSAEIISIEQAGEKVGIDPADLIEAAREGLFPAHQTSNIWFCSESDCMMWWVNSQLIIKRMSEQNHEHEEEHDVPVNRLSGLN